MTCLSNEALAERIDLDPVFNITYVDKLVAEIGAGIYEIRCMLSSLQMTKDQKTMLSDWDLLFNCIKAEMARTESFLDPAWLTLFSMLED